MYNLSHFEFVVFWGPGAPEIPATSCGGVAAHLPPNGGLGTANESAKFAA